MKPEDKKFLDENYQHWMTLQSGYIAGLNIHQRQGMLRCLREYFWPGYTYDEWCPSCVSEMVRHLYERYDKWLSQQPSIELREATPEESEKINEGLDELVNSVKESGKEIVAYATFPVNDKPDEAIVPSDIDLGAGIASAIIAPIDAFDLLSENDLSKNDNISTEPRVDTNERIEDNKGAGNYKPKKPKRK